MNNSIWEQPPAFPMATTHPLAMCMYTDYKNESGQGIWWWLALPCARPCRRCEQLPTVIFTPASDVYTWHTGHYPMNHTTHMTPTCPLHNPILHGECRRGPVPPIGFNTLYQVVTVLQRV